MELTFKQFLVESTQLSHQQIYDIVDDITDQCKPYLSEIKNPNDFKLYRGVSQSIPLEGVIHNTHRDREPIDTTPVFHTALDNWFNTKFNIRFRSHHTLFCTPSKPQAALYGNACVVYPIGKFEYIWSPQIKDLYAYLSRNIQQASLPNTITVEDAYKHINSWFKKDGVEYYLNTQLTANKTNEVMIHVPSFYIIPISTQKIIGYGLTKRIK